MAQPFQVKDQEGVSVWSLEHIERYQSAVQQQELAAVSKSNTSKKDVEDMIMNEPEATWDDPDDEDFSKMEF